MVGSIFVALAAMFILEFMGLSWRVLVATCAIPSVAGAILVHWVVPESPRFLALGSRHPEALHAANVLAQGMSYRGSLMTIEEMERSFPVHARKGQTPGLEGSGSVFSVMRLALTEFAISAEKLYRPKIRQTTLPLQMVWFSLSFGSYGLMTWINALFVEVHLKNVYFNSLLFAVSNLPGNLLTAIWMDKVGRSSMLVSCVLLAATSLLAFGACGSSGTLLPSCFLQNGDIIGQPVQEETPMWISQRRNTRLLLDGHDPPPAAAYQDVDVLQEEGDVI
jgi:MFS family permease